MVKNVELKIDWVKADSLEISQRAEYFDNLAEQIAKASENETDKKKVMAGSQVCYISAKYEELFLTCYNEFDVSRVLAGKTNGKTLEEKMNYFNTLAKKIANMPKEKPVSVPYGNKKCTVDEKYAGLFVAAYREFSKAKKELKELSKPTVVIDYEKASKLSNEKRADYFLSLIKLISEQPLKDDAEVVSVGKLSQKINKKDEEVFRTCYNEFEKAQSLYDEETKIRIKDAKNAVKKALENKSNKDRMDYYLEILTNIVTAKIKGHQVEKYIGSKSYIINISDVEEFDEAVAEYTKAKMLYEKEQEQLAKQQEYEIDKSYINKLSVEDRRDYLEDLLKKIINRELFMKTVVVHRGKESYTINAIDKKTYTYCESSISGIKHMLAAQTKTTKTINIADMEWKDSDNLEIIGDDEEDKDLEKKEEKEKKSWFKKQKEKIKEKQKEKKEKAPKSVASMNILEKLYLHRIKRLTSKPIKHSTRILVADMDYVVDHRYKERLYRTMLSYAKYKNKKKETDKNKTIVQNVYRGLIAAGTLLFAIVGVKLSKNIFAYINNSNNSGIETLKDEELNSVRGGYQTYAMAAMAEDNYSYDTLIKDIVDPQNSITPENSEFTKIEEFIQDSQELLDSTGEETPSGEINDSLENGEGLGISEGAGASEGAELGEGAGASEGNELGEGAGASEGAELGEGEGAGDEAGEGEEKDTEEKENDKVLEDNKKGENDLDKNNPATGDGEKEGLEEEEEELDEEEKEEELEGVTLGAGNLEQQVANDGEGNESLLKEGETIQVELQYTETYEAISAKVNEIGELPQETILNEDLNADKGNEEICSGYHLTTGNTIYDMPLWEALEVMYVGNAEDANTYQSCLAVFSCIANRMEDGRFTYANNFHDIISAGDGGQFSVWNQTKASNYQLDQVPDYVLQAYYDCFYGGIRNVDTIEFRSAGNTAAGRFQVVPGDNNHFKLVQHVDRADQKENDAVLVYTNN